MSALNVAFHAGESWLPPNALFVAVALLAVFLVFVGGRVIPFFRRNALTDMKVSWRARLDRTALGTTG